MKRFIQLLMFALGCATNSHGIDFAPASIYPVGAKPDAIVVGDFNGDGKPDIAVANAGSNSVSMLMGNGDGTLLAARSLDLGATSGAALTLAAGDFSGDHKLDLVVYIHGSALRLYLGNNDGTFQSPISLTGTGAQLFAADVNLDGKLDLVADASLLLGNGNATFQTARVLSAFSAQGGFSGTIALAYSVSGPAPMPACGITPTSVTPGNSATLTVSAPGLSATLLPLPWQPLHELPAYFVLPLEC